KKKTVGANDLQWKEIDLSDRVENVEGLFGLEELDGVDVDYSNGAVKFIVKDDESELQEPMEEIKEKIKVEAQEKAKQSTPEKAKKEKTKSKNKRTAKADRELEIKVEEDVNPFALLEEEAQDVSLPGWTDAGISLSYSLMHGLSTLGFNEPTEIQKSAIPEILNNRDVIGKASTGSGKTLAYGLAILEKHLQTHNLIRPPTGLIFAPTRELAHQIVQHLKAVSEFSPLLGSGVVGITGGLSIQKQKRLLEHNPAIIVATPGRFMELVKEDPQLVKLFKKVKVMVYDEADRLVQDGHFAELDELMEILGDGRTTQRQTLVFSATFQKSLMYKLAKKQKYSTSREGDLAEEQETIDFLVPKLGFREKNPKYIDANPTEAVSKQIYESIIDCGSQEKDLYLYYFVLLYPGRSIVFVNSIDAVKRITPILQELNIPAISIHSNMIQKQRLRSIEKFKANDRAILIATDVAARGLDIPKVEHVVHYHLPRSADTYVHRSGRTARAGAEGVSLLLCSPDEASGPLQKLRKLISQNKVKVPKLKHLAVDHDIISQAKERVSCAQKIAESVISSTGKGKDESWMKEAADELGVDISDDEIERFEQRNRKKKKGGSKEVVTHDELRGLRANLKDMLSRPLGRYSKYITNGPVNMAQMVLSGNSHESIFGHNRVSALNTLKEGKKSNK
ncbi:DEAD-domain-containing protein, partial [Nadsonia fulvescens var. elongata DSM 6958]